MPDKKKTIIKQLIAAGKTLHKLGMVPATSGNLSARVDNDRIAITVSGVHKGHLLEEDIIFINLYGNAPKGKTPSAETGLHLQLYQYSSDIQCVLHPHSRYATMTRNLQADRIVLKGYELQKAFEGVTSHTSMMVIPIFENDQDIPRLANETGIYLGNNADLKAYIIRGHGFYTWASSVSAALRHCEALEFLLGCELNQSISI